MISLHFGLPFVAILYVHVHACYVCMQLWAETCLQLWSTMRCYIILWIISYAMLFNTTLSCDVLTYCGVLWYSMLHNVMQGYVMQYYALLGRIIPFITVPCCTLLYNVMPCCAKYPMLWYSILRLVVMYYVIPWNNVLNYAMLQCTMIVQINYVWLWWVLKHYLHSSNNYSKYSTWNISIGPWKYDMICYSGG